MNLFKWLMKKRAEIVRIKKNETAIERMRRLVESEQRKEDELWELGTLLLGDTLRELYEKDPMKAKALSGHLSQNNS